MKRRYIILAAAMFATAYVARVNAAITYDLKLYAIDDSMAVSISNVNYTNHLVGTYNFGSTPTVSLDSFIMPGTNTISLRLANTSAGFSYSFGLLENGATVVSGACGIWNAADQACNGDSYQTGVVWTADITLNGVDGIVTWFDSGLVGPAVPRIPPSSPLQTPSVWLAYPLTSPGNTPIPLPASVYFFTAGLVGVAVSGRRRVLRGVRRQSLYR